MIGAVETARRVRSANRPILVIPPMRRWRD